MLCRKGLHPKDGPGRCLECRRAANRRWKRTPKGKAADKRWTQSEKGKEQRRKAQAKYEAESMTGFQYNLKLLKQRRYKALRARERRRLRYG